MLLVLGAAAAFAGSVRIAFSKFYATAPAAVSPGAAGHPDRVNPS